MVSSIVRMVVDASVMQYTDKGQATNLALHYLEVNRASPSDLKAIVVTGSMGEGYF